MMNTLYKNRYVRFSFILSVLLFIGAAEAQENSGGLDKALYENLRKLTSSRDRQDRGRLKTVARDNQKKLIVALDAKSSLHRRVSALALASAGTSPEAVKKLAKLLNDEEDDDVRKAMAGALSAMADHNGVVDALVVALDDLEAQVRRYAIVGLTKWTGNKKAMLALVEAAEDEDWQNRMQVIKALALSKDAKALAALEKMLEDENLFVKSAAGKALAVKNGMAPAKTNTRQGDKLLKVLDDAKVAMGDVKKKLDTGRIGPPVIVEMDEIEEALKRVIKKIAASQGQGKGKSKKKKKKGEKKDRGKEKRKSKKPGNKPSAPLSDSVAGSGATPEYSESTATVVGNLDDWARLPAKERQELRKVLEDASLPPSVRLLLYKYYSELSKAHSLRP